MTVMGTIVSFTATARLKGVVEMTALEKKFSDGGWIQTWRERYSNGVVRCDFVNMSNGNAATVDMVPSEDKNKTHILRIHSHDEGLLELIPEVIGDTIDPLKVNRADIGIFCRDS